MPSLSHFFAVSSVPNVSLGPVSMMTVSTSTGRSRQGESAGGCAYRLTTRTSRLGPSSILTVFVLVSSPLSRHSTFRRSTTRAGWPYRPPR